MISTGDSSKAEKITQPYIRLRQVGKINIFRAAHDSHGKEKSTDAEGSFVNRKSDGKEWYKQMIKLLIYIVFSAFLIV